MQSVLQSIVPAASTPIAYHHLPLVAFAPAAFAPTPSPPTASIVLLQRDLRPSAAAEATVHLPRQQVDDPITTLNFPIALPALVAIPAALDLRYPFEIKTNYTNQFK